MSCIYTDENCLISSLSSHLVCGVREEALKALFSCSLDCSKAPETLAEPGALCWCCIQIYQQSCRAFSISFYPTSFCLPLSHHVHPRYNIPVYLQLCDPRARHVSQDRVETLCGGFVSGWSPTSGRFPQHTPAASTAVIVGTAQPTKPRPTLCLDHSHSSCRGT